VITYGLYFGIDNKEHDDFNVFARTFLISHFSFGDRLGELGNKEQYHLRSIGF